MRLFDTHAHLNDESFDNDRDALIQSLPQHDVKFVIDVACDLDEADKTVDIIEKYPFIYASAGMHPHIASRTSIEHLERIIKYLEHPKVLALGETGLDYHYDFAPRDVQKKWFAAQLELAQQLDVPVILHVREAFGDAMDILRANRYKGIRGVMHCYSGSYEIAKECIDMGLYIAFGGAITFKNARRLTEVAAKLPLDRLLVETDCPYMTPEPHRGKRCDPSMIVHTTRKLAELKSLDVEQVADTAFKNGCELFGLALD